MQPMVHPLCLLPILPESQFDRVSGRPGRSGAHSPSQAPKMVMLNFAADTLVRNPTSGLASRRPLRPPLGSDILSCHTGRACLLKHTSTARESWSHPYRVAGATGIVQ